MIEWVNEIMDLNYPEYRRVLNDRIEDAIRADNTCVFDYFRTLLYSIAVNTLNRMPRDIYRILRDKYGDREPEILDPTEDPLVDLLFSRLLMYVGVTRKAVKGEVLLRFKEGVTYRIRIIVNIPKKIVHDEYVKFLENYLCGDEIEWRRCRLEEGVINDHELLLTKKEIRKYSRIC